MIRLSALQDLDEILEIYRLARAFMARSGNPNQWGDTYPPYDLVRRDILEGLSHVCVREDRIQGVFAFLPGEDPCYRVIRRGRWLNDLPYRAVHRVASRGEARGVAREMLTWALEQCGNVRIDTHPDNLPMQRALSRCGFVPCGQVYMEDGALRIGYQRTLPQFLPPLP